MPAHLLQEEISSSYTTTTTITAPPSRVLQNGGGKLEKTPLYLEEDIRPEMRDDIYDPTYQDKEGPKPKLEYVWRNIILMSLLHLGALWDHIDPHLQDIHLYLGVILLSDGCPGHHSRGPSPVESPNLQSSAASAGLPDHWQHHGVPE